jgi:surface protein
MGVEQLPGLPGDIAAPAAAYSVRKVRTAYTGSALRVRRDSDDLSFDVGFDASGNLDTGSLLTKMTASVTTTLPGDYSGLAAAYSLRRVSSSYSGYAIEVRRGVDNYSASIGFDGSGNLNTGSLASFIRTGSETPIDAYSGLAAAYSLRKVVSTYGGDAIEIQSGSVSQSIGFTSFGDLDVAAIKVFAGSGDAFVKTWYDQSGNGYHATQSVAANQPRIVYTGSIVTENGKPIIYFDGSNDFLVAPNTNLSINQRSTFTTFKMNSQKADGRVWAIWNGTGNDYDQTSGYILQQGNGVRNDEFGIFGSTGISYSLSTGVLTTVTPQTIVSEVLDGTVGSLYQNSTLRTSDSSFTAFGTTPLNNLYLGRGSSNLTGDISIQEFLFYTSSQASNRTYIENNINSYYGIYTPTSVSTENAFVKTWYDQSGNTNHATQFVTSSQPQIVNSGVIVTENGKPALNFIPLDFFEIASFNGNVTTTYSYFDVNTFSGFSSYSQLFGGPYGATATIYYRDPNGFGVYISSDYFNNSLVSLNTQTLMTLITSGSTAFNTYYNSQFKGSANPSTTNLALSGATVRISANPTMLTEFYNGKKQELLIFSSSLSSSRNLIEDNINGYYNIFTQSLASGSGYVTTWYDQSGNNRHATQSVAASQPLILSSGSINFINTKPGINFGYQGVSAAVKLATAAFPVGITSPYTVFTTFKATLDASQTIYDGLANNNQFNYNSNGYNLYSNDNTAGVLYGTGTTDQQTHIHIWGPQLKGAQNTSALTTGATRTVTLDGISLGHLRNPALSFAYQLEGSLQEVIFYASDQSSNRAPIQQDVNRYFNIYTQPAYNQNSNSLSLFSSPTVVAGAANASPTGLTTGGPEGLITVSRTGSGNYTLWKNRVPTKTNLPPSIPQSQSIYLNAANVSNALFSGSQNTVAYASVGAGLTDSEVYTYYELVDNLQTNLGRSKSTNPNAFITTWDTRISGTGTVTGTSSIALPLFGTQAITASWGDGTVSLISQSLQNDRIHTYATPGVYTVSITGTGQGFQFNNGGDRNKLLDVGQWGSISGSASDMFEGCSNLVGTAADPLIIQTTNLNSFFEGSSKFNGYINNWNTSNVTNFNNLFNANFGAMAFNQRLDNWNVEKVTSMVRMFWFNNTFNNNSISNWRPISCSNFVDTFYGSSYNHPINWPFSASNISMVAMFRGNSSFNQNIGHWDVSRVTSMNTMFYENFGFRNSGSSDINNWRPISCSNFSSMFQTSVFNQPIGNWPLSASNINMSSMFNGASSFNQNIGSWDVSRVTGTSTSQGFYRMFYNATSFNNSGSTSINNWRFTTSSTVTFAGMFGGDNTTTSTKFNQNIGAWNVEKVTNMSSMFLNNSGFNNSGSSDINNWRPISCSNFTRMFDSSPAFNQPIGNWPLSASTNNFSEMFYSATAFNQDIGSWDVSKATGTSSDTSFYRMFYRASAFNNSGSNSINNWRFNTSSQFNMSMMFWEASSFNQNIGSWNVEKAFNMTNMFATTPFNNGGSPDIQTWAPISCSNFNGMFQSATAFNQPVESWSLPTSRTYTMQNMFAGATSFNQPLGNWNIVSCSDMSGMLNSCGMDINNYSQTLIGWASQPDPLIPRNITLGSTGRQYTTPGSASRAILIADYNWTITGDTYVPS